jgi:hypothetical protein
MHYRIDRQIRHQTFICCITVTCDAHCPLLVSVHRSVTHVFEISVPNGIDLMIEFVSSLYVTPDIFNREIDEVVISAVISNRDLAEYKYKPAVLLWDNCSAHRSDEVQNKLAPHGILVITYQTHASHIFQTPEILLLGILKRAQKCQRTYNTPRREVDPILRSFRAHEQATASITIRASWGQTGFE